MAQAWPEAWQDLNMEPEQEEEPEEGCVEPHEFFHQEGAQAGGEKHAGGDYKYWHLAPFFFSFSHFHYFFKIQLD